MGSRILSPLRLLAKVWSESHRKKFRRVLVMKLTLFCMVQMFLLEVKRKANVLFRSLLPSRRRR